MTAAVSNAFFMTVLLPGDRPLSANRIGSGSPPRRQRSRFVAPNSRRMSRLRRLDEFRKWKSALGPEWRKEKARNFRASRRRRRDYFGAVVAAIVGLPAGAPAAAMCFFAPATRRLMSFLNAALSA